MNDPIAPEVDANRPLLIEVAWEVCNQIGGIFTVIKSKAPTMVEKWGDNYLLIGPYNKQTSEVEFEEASPPLWMTEALRKCREAQIECRFGRWLIEGNPNVLLIDFSSRANNLGLEKYLLWKDHGISSDNAGPEVDEVISFGFAVTEFVKGLYNTNPRRRIIAHLHEWMAGVAIPRIQVERIPVATVFTTHATLLGRYMASENAHFYSDLKGIDPVQAAHHYNISTRFLIERSAANNAAIFTTVSGVTAKEAKHFLGRQPDFLLPNGLNPERFAALHEFQNLHLKYKERIHEFVMGHFFPSYPIDLDRTLYVFTSGRYEYRNKGMDIFIESLYQLNERLKSVPKPPTVVAFIVTKAASRSLNVTSLERHLMFEDLKSSCEEIESGFAQRILEAAARGRMPSYEELLSKDMQVRLKRAILARRGSSWPPVVTHDLNNDGEDVVLRHLRHRNLLNSPQDPVKVIFHPDFITVTNPLFNLDYDQFVRGCHLGVFPSYYEPWGYTPLECLAFGIPTVTTDLSGFGEYVQANVSDSLNNGVMVLNRATQSNDQCIDELGQFLFRFCSLSRRERINLRNRAERLMERFTWSVLAAHYHRAHAAALEKVFR